LRVRDLRYYIQYKVHLRRPLEIEGFNERDHLNVVGENTDQDCLGLVSLRFIEQITINY
jgi:hypothetical protein